MKDTLYIITAPCYRCTRSMLVAVIDGKGIMRDPNQFTQNEIRIAREHHVLITGHYSGTIQDSYYANTCPGCNAFIGKRFLFADYFSAALNGDYDFDEIDLDYGHNT